jgi:hypothetical protein
LIGLLVGPVVATGNAIAAVALDAETDCIEGVADAAIDYASRW